MKHRSKKQHGTSLIEYALMLFTISMAASALVPNFSAITDVTVASIEIPMANSSAATFGGGTDATGNSCRVNGVSDTLSPCTGASLNEESSDTE